MESGYITLVYLLWFGLGVWGWLGISSKTKDMWMGLPMILVGPFALLAAELTSAAFVEGRYEMHRETVETLTDWVNRRQSSRLVVGEGGFDVEDVEEEVDVERENAPVEYVDVKKVQ